MKIIWCEQSGVIEDREQFISSLEEIGIGYRRLNWRDDEQDLYANVECPAPGISWSRGRDVLFNSVSSEMQQDDYIILADDDIKIEGGRKGLLSLQENLIKYRPPLAVPYSTNKHHFSTGMEYQKYKNPDKPFPVFLVDLQVQVFRMDFAKYVFPSLYDGGYGTYWYAYFFCALKYGFGALCLPQFRINNLRHDNPSGDYGGKVNHKEDTIFNDSLDIMPLRVKMWFLKTGNRQVAVRMANSWYASRPSWLLFGSPLAKSKIARFRNRNSNGRD